jgi:4-amino-4-deoxychorismate lyase
MNNIYFETIKCDDFKVYNLHYHQIRIARTIGLNISLDEYIYPPNEDLLKCKVIYNSNGILDISFSPYSKKDIKTFKLIYDNTIVYDKKSIDRRLIDKHKINIIEDEIIFVKNNLITDTSIANIAIYINNQWITPKTPLLKGTTTSRYINNNLIISKDITVKMLLESEKFALLNAMIDFNIIKDYYIKE